MTSVPGATPFPGWEPFVPQLVHPIKVAAVSALLRVGRPLSAAQVRRKLCGTGEVLNESTVRYHLNHLVEVGMLEVIPGASDVDADPRAKFFYFAARPAGEKSCHMPG